MALDIERGAKMILGASHITLGCNNLDAAVASLEGYGYRPDFLDRNVINNPSKQSILAADCKIHGIGMLRSAGGFPIELVHYRDQMPDRFGRYVGVFEAARAPAGANDMDFWGSFAGMPSDMVSKWATGMIGNLNAPAFFVRGVQANTGLRQVVLPVSDLGSARRFWCEVLGFALVRETKESAEVRFASPVAAWTLQLILVTSPPSKARSVLDAKGMACLSLISSNVADDVLRVIAGGARLQTEIFAIPINGRNMKVAILTDPDGAFVELLQIVR
jgi:catechol 2,3-dioxygenase-like lactoylglutathione lyase family enzyme